MSPIILAMLLGVTAATANVVGGTIIVQKHWERSYLKYFIALGSGFMLATALIEMVPESLKPELNHNGWAPFLILGGYLLVHFFEHTVTGHFHFGEETHEHELAVPHRSISVLLGLLIHAFFDGIAIASGFLVSNWLGWIVFLAVFLHKMPEGFAVSSVMRASGASARTALNAAVLLGAATVAGALIMSPLRGQVEYTLPFSAGVTLYVAASDLIPVVNQEPNVKLAMLVFVGFLLLLALQWAFGL